MAYKEQDVVLTTKDTSGNTVIQMPITRAENVENLKSTCLPLTGGGLIRGFIRFDTFSGTRIQANSDDDGIAILGGSGWSTGGRALVYGKDHASFPGYVFLTAANGESEKSLILRPDGTATWNGKDLFTSAGGKITGAIYTSSTTSVIQAADNSYTGIYGASQWNKGAFATFYGGEHPDRPWMASIVTFGADGAQKRLDINPDGRMVWDGKRVVCVESWTASDNRSWYRKYSDGFIEQGGFQQGAKNSITFPTAFSGAITYSLVANNYQQGVNDSDGASHSFALSSGAVVSSRTATGFSFYNNIQFSWYACGY